MERPKDMRYLEVGDKLIITNWWGTWVVKITEIREFAENNLICKEYKFSGMEEEGIDSLVINPLCKLAPHPYYHWCIMDVSEFYIFSGTAPFKSHCDEMMSSIKYNMKKIDEVW